MSRQESPLAEGGRPRPFISASAAPLSSWVLPPLATTAPPSRHSSSGNGLPSSPSSAFSSFDSLPRLLFQPSPRLIAHQFLPALRDIRAPGDEVEGGVSEERVQELVKAAVLAAFQQRQRDDEALRQQWHAQTQQLGHRLAQVQEAVQAVPRDVESVKRRVEERVGEVEERLGRAEDQLRQLRRGLSCVEEEVADVRAAAARRAAAEVPASQPLTPSPPATSSSPSPPSRCASSQSSTASTPTEAATDGGLKEPAMASKSAVPTFSTSAAARGGRQQKPLQSSAAPLQSTPLSPSKAAVPQFPASRKGTPLGELAEQLLATERMATQKGVKALSLEERAKLKADTDSAALRLLWESKGSGSAGQKKPPALQRSHSSSQPLPRTEVREAAQKEGERAECPSPDAAPQLRRSARRRARKRGADDIEGAEQAGEGKAAKKADDEFGYVALVP